ncbi:MAG: hypothetical protein SFV54_10525 [Bryobacteraceae bacterium]|nr:hypothetical protein [Bryobacteraceae bacterium]
MAGIGVPELLILVPTILLGALVPLWFGVANLVTAAGLGLVALLSAGAPSVFLSAITAACLGAGGVGLLQRKRYGVVLALLGELLWIVTPLPGSSEGVLDKPQAVGFLIALAFLLVNFLYFRKRWGQMAA